ncbi:divergent PAP2 family protein [Erysipelothrix urinaevulpis]|uniref:divergent PAP2 family protein n=1 Tax=Erysipelothrix urinaevulpis TaxID=2683717 RepID=UPI00135A1500|nr:divergent PAP2 family protein [Erysipelothrix urinaevulpis]
MLEKFYPIIAAVFANLLAQIIKPIPHYLQHREWKWTLIFDSGGFPSSHSSLVVGLTTALGLQSNFQSNEFFIAAVFSLTVLYDAANVRYYTGQNIKLTKQLIEDVEVLLQTNLDNPIYQQKIKMVLGHKWVEVFGGIILGILSACLLYLKIG